jgi:transcriptional regulator with XRE-family HTH domain
VSSDQQQFCARLKAARLRKGISLEQIAASTKISASLLEGLEANNLTRWPTGIYRRAYLRDYLTAIGLPTEPTVQEFRDLFPLEETDAFLRVQPPPASISTTQPAPPAAVSATQWPRGVRIAADAGLMIAIAATASALWGGTPWSAATIAVLGYHVITAGWPGKLPRLDWRPARPWRLGVLTRIGTTIAARSAAWTASITPAAIRVWRGTSGKVADLQKTVAVLHDERARFRHRRHTTTRTPGRGPRRNGTVVRIRIRR